MTDMPPTPFHLARLPWLSDLLGVLLGAAGLALLLAHWSGLAPLPDAAALAAVLFALLCVLLVVRNRQRAMALQRTHRALQQAQALAHVGSWQLCGDDMIWSDESCRIFGLPAGSRVNAQQLLEFTHPEDRHAVAAAWASLLAGQGCDIEHRIVIDGATRWVHARGEAHRDAEGRLLAINGTVQDVTERKQAEEALQRSGQRLRALGAHHERRVEEERAHIAREIHDELGQYLTTLRLDAAMLEMHCAGEHPRIAERLGTMKRLIDDTIHSVRRVASTLRPKALDLGLDSGVEWLVEDFERRHGIACALHMPDEGLARVDDARATLAFRIVQEALTNIVRHADASAVTVRVDIDADALHLQVRDDGRGFDAAAPCAGQAFGLFGMQERAMVFGGTLRIDSAAGRGTAVCLSVPLADTQTSAVSFPQGCAGCPLLEPARPAAEVSP